MSCNWCDLAAGGRLLAQRLSQTANLMVGLPDYDVYVAHRRALHPREPVMNREEFFRERQRSRYGDSGRGFRCC
jgi:uncharacterized short protein YbdD (DUF466 family)